MPDNKKAQSQQSPPLRLGPGGRGPGRPGPFDFAASYEKPENGQKTLIRLTCYLAKGIKSLGLILLLSIGAALVNIAATRISGTVVDDYILQKDAAGLAMICGLLLGIYLTGIIASYLQERLLVRLTQTTTAAMRKDLFGHIASLPLAYYDSHSSGDLMSRLTNDVDTISMAMSQSVTQLFSGVVSLTGTLIAMLILSPRLTLVTVAVVPVMLLFTRSVAKVSRKLFKQQSAQLGLMNGYIEEIISGEKVVKLFSREEKVKEEFADLNRDLKSYSVKAQFISGMMGPVMNMINNISYLIVAVAGGYMVVQNLVSVGDVFVFLQYKRQFSMPINQLANLFNTVQSALAAAERIFEVMDQQPEADLSDTVMLPEIKGEITFADVTFSYVPDKPVLKNACLKASPGDRIAIVGPTGAGKTTIISLLTRFYDADSGAIMIDGTDIRHIRRNSLRRSIGMVLQDTWLFSETVRENIRYGTVDATDDDVIRAAKMANAHQFISHLPQGYDTVLADNGGNLSQGQRQLLAIARVILADPQVLILDEATSSIDTRTEINIQQALLTLMKGRTSFIIAHRLSTIKNADSILVIQNGEVVESGTHTELLGKDDGIYAHLYQVQYATGLAL